MQRNAFGRYALAAFFLAAAMAVTLAQETSVLQEFTIKEAFGVAHPDQIIEFDLAKPVNPASTHVLGLRSQLPEYGSLHAPDLRAPPR